jgi:hypothetical protein
MRIPSQQEEKSISAPNEKASVKDDFHINNHQSNLDANICIPCFLAVQMAPQINV